MKTLNDLKTLFVSIGGVWLPVKNIDRGLYHAALSIISNVTKGVTWKAQNWLENAGIPEQMATAVAHELIGDHREGHRTLRGETLHDRPHCPR